MFRPELDRAADRRNPGAGVMGADPELRTWRSRIAVQAAPELVLETLTDVSACRAWSPVGFTVDGLDGLCLRPGATPRVSGNLGGRRVHFQVQVLQADAERLRLYATGPVEMVVDYAVEAASPGSSVEAAVSVRAAPGWIGTVSERLTGLLLAGGALNRALARMAREAERRDVQRRARRRSSPPAAQRALAQTAPAR
jgi:polyketide cyclase/dehydrase/lipid transport protein